MGLRTRRHLVNRARLHQIRVRSNVTLLDLMKLVVVPHDPNWNHAYESEAKLIAAALGFNVVAVHHIGSTAIPDIYAKPVIDFLVEVRDINEVDGQSAAMKKLGYEVMGEFGIPGRRYFRKDNPAGVRTHQVHTFAAGSDQVTRHLAFRDYLIEHPDVALEYSNLKRNLAEKHPDNPDAYMDGKDDFIKSVDARATKTGEE